MSDTNNSVSSFKLKLLGLLVVTFIVAFSAYLFYLDNTIRNTFEGKKWSVPSIVYARPLSLYQGAPVSVKDLKHELTRLTYQFVREVKKPGQVSINGERVELYTRGFHFPDEAEPPRRITMHFSLDKITAFSSDDGVSLLRLAPITIGGIYPAHHEDRLLVQENEVPLTLKDMLIAVEDNNFYAHNGLSFRGIARAIIANIKGGGYSQGASTLTQQLVKNYYLTAEKTLSRKAQEALMSLLIELHFSKEKILEGYLNEVYLGQDGPRAIHGFGLASQYYFRQPLARLSLHQQALLVTLVRGASYYNPWRHPKRVKLRRDRILDIALAAGKIDITSVQRAKNQALDLADKSTISRQRYPAYLDLVRRQLQRDYKLSSLKNNGLSIFTHFDPLIQSSAEENLRRLVKQQKDNPHAQNLQGAVVVTRPNTGAVIAIVGGQNAKFAGFNRALDAQRQVGSLIKPAVYLTALTQGQGYHLATPLDDSPYALALDNDNDNDQQWRPQNYDKQFHGDVLLYKALANSYNVSTARLGNAIGLNKIIETIHQLGAPQPIIARPSLTLGALAMSPFDVAKMYQTLATDGFYTPLFAIDAVVNSQRELLTRYALNIEQRFDPARIYQLRYALQAATREGTARALQWLLPDFAVAGKTGTTNNLRDSWFAGFSGDMMAVVWVGNDDNSSTGLTGSSGALRVWANIFKQRSKLEIQNIPPKNIDIAWVDKQTGVGIEKSCKNAMAMPFIKGNAPVVEIRCGSHFNRVVDWFYNIL